MKDENSLPESLDLAPLVSFEPEFVQWVKEARGGAGPRQHPVDELLAEHHMMDSALTAMEAETYRLGRGQLLRNDVWTDIIDFVGNYVHLVHRRKEAQALLTAFSKTPGDNRHPAVLQIEGQHSNAARLTFDLVDGLNEGDWEKVLRTAQLYISFARPHLRYEEAELFDAVRDNLTAEQIPAVQSEFTRLEAFGLGERDRLYYLAVAQRLAKRAGLDVNLEPKTV